MAILTIGGRRTVDVPVGLLGVSMVVAGAMLLPLAYLIVRVAGAGVLWDEISATATREALVRTVVLAAGVTCAATAIAVPLAWLTVRTDLPVRGVWAVVFALPLAVPSYVGAFAFVGALGPRGMLQGALEPLGVDRLPAIYGFWGAWATLTLFTFPYVLLPVRAALRNMDRSFEEAARGLGAGGLETFFRVTLPQLRPAVAAGALLVALYALSDFGAVSILRFDSLTRVIYVRYTSSFDRSSAAALALLLVALSLVIVAIEGSTRGRGRYHAGTRHEAARVVALGWWRWPALACCAAVAAASLVLPLSVMGYWLARGIDAGQSMSFVRETAFNSVYASVLGAALTVAAALPVALLAVRHPGPVSSTIEKITYSGFALPGITIALALVFFAARYATPVYQTLGLLVFAYAVRFLPEAVGACRSALLQVNPNGEQAARGLGRGRAYVFARVTLPQMLPGLSGGAMLVFLTAMKELPATLILSPFGFDTLATQIWHSTTEARFGQAALPALILVAVSSVPMALTMLRDEKAR
ncbi:MAG: iron ABC transporter permease [Dehalococcoidia bacterium]